MVFWRDRMIVGVRGWLGGRLFRVRGRMSMMVGIIIILMRWPNNNKEMVIIIEVEDRDKSRGGTRIIKTTNYFIHSRQIKMSSYNNSILIKHLTTIKKSNKNNSSYRDHQKQSNQLH